MDRKQLVIGLLVGALLLGTGAYAASTWEGSAVVAAPSDFPGEGLYGACNSFPLNSTVEVENLETGRKVSVVITRNVDNPAVFMALSPKAASDLGMKAGSTARVRVLAPAAAAATLAPATQGKASESTDPDFNPRLLGSIKASPTTSEGVGASKDFMSLLGQSYAAPVEAPQAPATLPASEPAPSPAKAVAAAAPVALPTPPSPPGPEAPSDKLGSPEASAASPSLATPVLENPEASATALSPSPSAPVEVASLPEAVAPSPPAPPAQPEAAPVPAPAPEPRFLGLDALPPEVQAPWQPTVALAEPEANPSNELGATTPAPSQPGEASVALASAPSQAGDGALSLPDPSLGPDLLPQAILDRLAQPASPALSIALAESEAPPPEAEAVPDKPILLAQVDLPSPESAAKPQVPETLPAPVAQAPAPAPEPEPETPVAAAPATPVQVELPPAQVPSPEPEPLPPAKVETPKVAALPMPSPEASAEKTVALVPTEARPPEAPVAAPAAKPVPEPAPIPVPTPAPAPIVAPAPAPSLAVTPPKAPEAAKAQAGPAKEPKDLSRLLAMKKDAFYVQLGLFGSEDSLRKAIAAARKYPLLYETVVDPKGQVLYRLYIGPLSRDEGGGVLVRIKGLGYKDAVLKKG